MTHSSIFLISHQFAESLEHFVHPKSAWSSLFPSAAGKGAGPWCPGSDPRDTNTAWRVGQAPVPIPALLPALPLCHSQSLWGRAENAIREIWSKDQQNPKGKPNPCPAHPSSEVPAHGFRCGIISLSPRTFRAFGKAAECNFIRKYLLN